MDFTLLLDSPREPRRTIQIAKIGEDFEHPKYGQFGISTDDIASWKANLPNLPGGRALIDEDHSADRTPRRTEASGWITDIRLENGTPVVDVDWTPKGEAALREARYAFISPTFGNFTDERGEVHENTLIGAALTNRPFLNMPSLCLASEERVSEAIDEDPALRFHTRALDGEYGATTQALVTLDVSQAERNTAKTAGHSLPDGSYPIANSRQLHSAAVLAASKHGDWHAAESLIRRRARDLGVDVNTLPGFGAGTPDSRPLDMPNEALLKTLGLPEDTDEQKLLDTVTALKAEADKPAEPVKPVEPAEPVKTLEQQAADAGVKILDAEQFGQLTRQAAAGETAMKQLHAQRFETAFELALNNASGAKVTPSEKESLQHFYTLDADATLKMIEDRKPVVSAKPHGDPTIELDLDTGLDATQRTQLASQGVAPDSVLLDQKIRKHMTGKGLPESAYVKVLDQWQSGELIL